MREEDRGQDQGINVKGFPKDIPPKGILSELDGVVVGPHGEVFTEIIGPDPSEPLRELERLREEWTEERGREIKEKWRRVLRSLDEY